MRSRCPYYPHPIWCPQCNGGATVGFDKKDVCRMCDGTGISRDPEHAQLKKRPECRFCNGSGRVDKVIL